MKKEVGGGKFASYVLVIAMVIALYVFSNSSFFETAEVEWSGLVYLDGAQLDAYLDLPLVNVWRLNGPEVAAVLEEHPWIEKAEIRWKWPNRIQAVIFERTPLAQIPTKSGWLLLDKHGTLLSPTLSSAIYPLPVVTNLDLADREQLGVTARLLELIPDSLEQYFSEWNVQTQCFISRSGTEIVMGSSIDAKEKFRLLEMILEDLAGENKRAKKIDLRVPKNPVVSII